MSLKGSEREFIFSLYLKEHKRILEDVVGRGLTDLLLESYWRGYKLDLLGYEAETGIPVISEIWLGRSPGYHQERLLNLINELDEGALLIYLTIGFQVNHVRELEQHVSRSDNPIKLLLVRINDQVKEPLERLNAMNKLEIYDSLGLLDEVPKPLRIVTTIEHPRYKFLCPKPVPNNHDFDFSKRADVNRYVLYRLREAVPNFLPLQREKHFDEEKPNSTIMLGGGRTGVQFFISARNRRNQAFIELRFDRSNSELFQLFSMKPWLLREQIDERVKVGDNAIGCYFKASDNVKETVDELVRIFSRMIENVSYPLFDIFRYEYQIV
ncbi:hypothetical protein [Alicyclobacillus sp. ALC3]|uniref:hypothetical protein n=1 Tax=Alicyclobacillus sp. ALC3 TaxID=2796143 RepID=UPI00237896A8|nr:hypothetical protein [Alicyclobacillus sp. ALC3]WDL98864.1 hypothetical protein JC200_09520 [Alicyclobacillus sp. ALC3]